MLFHVITSCFLGIFKGLVTIIVHYDIIDFPLRVGSQNLLHSYCRDINAKYLCKDKLQKHLRQWNLTVLCLFFPYMQEETIMKLRLHVCKWKNSEPETITHTQSIKSIFLCANDLACFIITSYDFYIKPVRWQWPVFYLIKLILSLLKLFAHSNKYSQ